MIYSANLLRGLINLHQKPEALKENANSSYAFLKNTLANNQPQKKIQGKM